MLQMQMAEIRDQHTSQLLVFAKMILVSYFLNSLRVTKEGGIYQRVQWFACSNIQSVESLLCDVSAVPVPWNLSLHVQ
jgi:hypothetical protein